MHLPEEAGIEAILGFLRATHRMPPEELVGFDVLSPGAVYRENGVTGPGRSDPAYGERGAFRRAELRLSVSSRRGAA